MKKYFQLLFFLLLSFWFSCSGPGLFGKKKSPHQQYASKIKESGLDKTSLGRKWLLAADESLFRPVDVSIPYSERGYFASDKPSAVGLRFKLTRGEKIRINLDERPTGSVRIFVDLLRPSMDNTTPTLIKSADTLNSDIQYEVERTGDYILRIQPELLGSGEYLLNISAGPSLAFPVPKGNIKSIWGDPRDAGGRKHEGIDIFAPKYTPALAAADGRINKVNENNLGGRVVWLNVANKNYTLYYAHLDRQLVSDGDQVRAGDTVGLIGNTGNARTTPAHLHFGIYTFSGAVDPLPFVNHVNRDPLPITASTVLIGREARTVLSSKFYSAPNVKDTVGVLDESVLLNILGATADWYKVNTPDGLIGFVRSDVVGPLKNNLDPVKLKSEQPLYDHPDLNAARKVILAKGEQVELLASFNHFYFVKDKRNNKGWIGELNEPGTKRKGNK